MGASELRTWDSFATRVGALAPLWTSQGIGFTPLEGIDWVSEDATGTTTAATVDAGADA